jgi:hypothetical protein
MQNTNTPTAALENYIDEATKEANTAAANRDYATANCLVREIKLAKAELATLNN